MANKHFKVKFPGSFYAGDFYATSLAECKDQVRACLNVKRLPRGVEIWTTTPRDVKIVQDSIDAMARDYRKAGQIFDL